MKKIIKSILKSFKHAFITNEEVQRLVNKYPRLFYFYKKRIDKAKFTGLPLTIFGLCFFYILVLFLSVVQDFITADIIIQADERINTLLYVFRNATAVKTFIWITLLGESWTIIVFILLTSIFLFLANKKWHILGLWLATIGSEGFTYLAKIIFQRSRPLNSVLLETSASFPSGHATIAVSFYGFIVYLLIKKMKKKRYRILTTLSGIILALLIGFSRLYLGVHYTSDIWAGYLVGLLWLIIGISLTEWKLSHNQPTPTQIKITTKQFDNIFIGLVGTAIIFYIACGLSYNPKLIPGKPITIEATVKNVENMFIDYNLSRHTETLTGDTQEPISFIISAQNDNLLVENFKKAGWLTADSVNIHSSIDMAKFAILNQEYATAPMTPSFWNKEVHNFGFQKATEIKSIRQRHHARFWKTNIKTADGQNIYVGTVSFDIGLKWLITHKISPDIDTERELLFSDLQNINALKYFSKTKLVKPTLGKNFGGDQFFTDGEAYFIYFQ